MQKKVLKLVFIILAIFCVVFIGFNIRKIKTKNPNSANIFVGFPQRQTGIIKEMEFVRTEYDYIEKGNEYLENGEIDKAIAQYNIVLKRDKKTSALMSAKRGLINAYEKDRGYSTAADLLDQKLQDSKIPNDDKWRMPEEERLKYLRYATEGNYEMAVEHAKKALVADARLPNRPKEGSFDYLDRLNDIKSAKEYIESLRKN